MPSHSVNRPGTIRISLAVGAVCVLGAAAVAGAVVPHPAGVPALTPLVSALLPGLSTPTAAHLTDNGAVAADQTIGVDLTLARPDAAGEAAETTAIETPGNADYHHYLTPTEFSSRYGVSSATYDTALGFLTAHGLTLVSSSAGHDELRVTGTATQVETTFATRLENFTTSKGVHFYANTTAPLLPSSLPVIGVFGLETWHRSHLDSVNPRPAQSGCDVPGTCTGDVTPQDMWGAYDQPSLITGKGQKLAIFGEGAYNYIIKDLVQFETENKLPIHDNAGCACAPAGSAAANNVRVVLTDGPKADYTSTDGDGEWQLDTQSSTGMAYNVDELDMYWGSALTDDSTLQTLASFVSDSDGPSQASASYGECEAQVGDPGSVPLPGVPVSDPTGLTFIGNPFESVAYETSYEKQLGQGIMEGKTLFSSSGDNGSSCGALPVDLNGVSNADGATMTDYPASSPQVVGVGGTVLYTDGGYENTVSTPTKRVDEYGWTDGGGGPDALFPEPAYQDAVSAVNIPCLGNPDGSVDTAGNTCRGVPDISAISGDVVSNGYNIVMDTKDSATGGTSLSSPLSVGLWTRIQSGTGGTAGFANLAFYKYCNDFFDVGAIGGAATMPSDNGAEGLYPTDTGWDYVTGLGTMDVTKLIADIKAGTPAQTCAKGTITVPLGRNPGTPSPTPAPSSSPKPSGSPTPSASSSPTPAASSPSAPVTIGSGFHPLGYAGIGSATIGGSTRTMALAGHGGIPTSGVRDVLTQITIDHASKAASLTTTGGRVLATSARSATTRTLALIPEGSGVPLALSSGSARVSLAAVGYDGPTDGDSFIPARLGRDSATLTPTSTSKKDLVVSISGKSGIPAGSLDAALLLVRVTDATTAGTLTASLKGTSAALAVTSYAGSKGTTDVVIVARPDSHGQVHLRLSQGSARVVVDQLGGYVKGAGSEKLYAMGSGGMTLGGTISTVGRTVRLAGGSTPVPSGAGQALTIVTLTNPSATGELLVGGSREGQVSVVKGVSTTVLLPITLRGDQAVVKLSRGTAGISLTEVGYTG